MTTRRGFLGGCITALCTNALTSGACLPIPRYWERIKIYGPKEFANRPLYEIVIFGKRSDDMFFYVIGEVVNATTAPEIIPTLRSWLDSYLNPACMCRPGFDCGIHLEHKTDLAYLQSELINRDLGIFVAK